MQRRLSGQALRRLLGALRGCCSPAEAQLSPGAALPNLPVTLSTQRLAWSSCACPHGPALQAPGAVAQWQAARVRRRVLLSCIAALYLVSACPACPLERSSILRISVTFVLCQNYHCADDRPTVVTGSVVYAARTGGASSRASPAHSAASDAERRWC